MDICWVRGCDIPTLESSHVPPITNWKIIVSGTYNNAARLSYIIQVRIRISQG